MFMKLDVVLDQIIASKFIDDAQFFLCLIRTVLLEAFGNIELRNFIVIRSLFSNLYDWTTVTFNNQIDKAIFWEILLKL